MFYEDYGDNETSKHITCVYGAFYLVVVDYREDSPTYLQWDSFTLDDKNMKSVLVPPGFSKRTFMFIRRVCISLHSILSK